MPDTNVDASWKSEALSDEVETRTVETRLAALRHADPSITSILKRATFVCVYVLNEDDQLWSRADIEGPLYLVTRDASLGGSRFRLVILNQKNPRNLVEDITKISEISTDPHYLFFRVPIDPAAKTHPLDPKDRRVAGLWFADDSERRVLEKAITEILQELIAGGVSDAAGPRSPPDTPALNTSQSDNGTTGRSEAAYACTTAASAVLPHRSSPSGQAAGDVILGLLGVHRRTATSEPSADEDGFLPAVEGAGTRQLGRNGSPGVVGANAALKKALSPETQSPFVVETVEEAVRVEPRCAARGRKAADNGQSPLRPTAGAPVGSHEEQPSRLTHAAEHQNPASQQVNPTLCLYPHHKPMPKDPCNGVSNTASSQEAVACDRVAPTVSSIHTTMQKLLGGGGRSEPSRVVECYNSGPTGPTGHSIGVDVPHPAEEKDASWSFHSAAPGHPQHYQRNLFSTFSAPPETSAALLPFIQQSNPRPALYATDTVSPLSQGALRTTPNTAANAPADAAICFEFLATRSVPEHPPQCVDETAGHSQTLLYAAPQKPVHCFSGPPQCPCYPDCHMASNVFCYPGGASIPAADPGTLCSTGTPGAPGSQSNASCIPLCSHGAGIENAQLQWKRRPYQGSFHQGCCACSPGCSTRSAPRGCLPHRWCGPNGSLHHHRLLQQCCSPAETLCCCSFRGPWDPSARHHLSPAVKSCEAQHAPLVSEVSPELQAAVASAVQAPEFLERLADALAKRLPFPEK